MRARWLGLAAAVVVGAGAASGIRVEPAAAELPEAFVEAQFATGVTMESLNGDGSTPSLAQQGYRLLPVPEGMTAREFAAELRTRPDVLQAVPSVMVQAAAIPNDTYYASGAPTQAQYLTQIGAPEAWDLSTGSNQITVAFVDSGLDLGHPEFAGRLWENPIDNLSDGVDRDNNGYVNDRYGYRFIDLTGENRALCGYTSSAPSPNVSDDFGHGTNVAGVIGAAGNNGQGIAGVAWNARLMTVKVLDCRGKGFPANVGHGIEYAVKNGARVINVSIATDTIQDGDSPTLRAAIQMAQNAGVIVVAAAGNFARGAEVGTRYPAAYTEFPNLIAVGASNNLNGNEWATYSNYGPAIDFAAPGNRIVSTARSNTGLANPYVELGTESGTSFSTALVSGMFALMISRNSRLPASDIIQIARTAATPAPPAPHGQNWAGSGIINIGAAVARVPMSIVSGVPLRDWRDVPAGTTIEATIDGQSCGFTTSDAFGLQGRFNIRIKSDAELANCGRPGKTVQLFIGGAPAVPTLTWGAPNADLGLRDLEISTVSPPPGALVVQALNGSWANIAHLEPTGALPSAAPGLPTPWTSIYKWDPAKSLLGRLGAYLRFFRGAPSYASDYPVISQYDAYWVDAPAQNMASPNPSPPLGRTIQLKAGWNNFTYTGESRAVADALESVDGKYSQVLQFDNATSTWLTYQPITPVNPRFLNDFGGLFTLKVYWVLMTSDGTLVMD